MGIRPWTSAPLARLQHPGAASAAVRSRVGLRACHGRAGGAASASASGRPDVEALTRRPAKLMVDYLTPGPSHLLTTTLEDLLGRGASASSPVVQEPARALRQGHHLVYFPLQTAPSALAADGADADHGPGGPYVRRLWAGGELIFRAGWHGRLLLDGRSWACRETMERAVLRGDKVFVDVWRRYGLGHVPEIEERRTLVFLRPDHMTSRPGRRYPQAPSLSTEPFVVTPAHLFYFSALTFNAHAIHLDPLYAAQTDGHRALLVHGPLTLALMLHLLAPVGRVERFVYTNHERLFAHEPLRLCARPVGPRTWHAWVEGPEGNMAVKGEATMEDA